MRGLFGRDGDLVIISIRPYESRRRRLAATVFGAETEGRNPVTTDASGASTLHGLDMDAIAQAVLDCPSVMGLGNEIATWLFGRRIAGVCADDGVVHVHVLGRYDVSVEALCAEISKAMTPLVPSHIIDIAVIDMVDPHEFVNTAGA